MAYDRKDHFYKKAKREGKASRAVYKLSELQKRFRLIHSGDVVLDLGSAPGGWLQEISPMVGPKGKIVGIDLLPLKISPPQNSVFILGDLNDDASLMKIRELAPYGTDVVLSDMSPNLSGIAFADAFRSYELLELAFDACNKLLKSGGNFVAKFFPGEESEGFIKNLKTHFKKVTTVVPEATRKTSSERYLVALKFKK